MNCLIYSRVSTEEQAERGRSINDQVKICEKFAKENDYKIVGVYKDAGKSASSMNRPALQDLLIRCQEEKIEAVLVQDTDRLARNSSDHLQIKALLKKNGARVYSVSQPMVSGDSPESQFIDLVIAGMNAFQSQITGRKTSKVMEQKVLEGWWPGVPRLGYKNARVDERNIIVIDRERSPYIKKAFELFAKGNHAVEKINEILFNEGLRSRDGKGISKATLFEILHDPFYTGKMLYKGQIYQGKQEALISEDLFETCQQVFCDRNQNAVRSRKYKYLLRGFAYCNECGKRMYAEKHIKKSGLTFDFYFCQNCREKYYHSKEVEKGVEELFKQIRLPKTLIDKIILKARGILDDTHNKVDKNREILEGRKVSLEKRRNTLETKLLEEIIDNDTYKRQHEGIENEIKVINEQVANLYNNRNDNIEVFERLVLIAHSVHKAYLQAPDELKRHYISLFWEKILLKDGGIEKTVPSKLIQALFSQNPSETKSMVRVKFHWLPEQDSNLQHPR